MKIKAIKKCRVCGHEELLEVLDLGKQELTGVFPKDKSEKLTEGPLRLLFCPHCGLVQLAHSYDLGEMYGDNYGYRSGLNIGMVNHLKQKVEFLSKKYELKSGDVVVDISSNDGTTLNSYKVQGLRRIGIDPTGIKFRQYYEEGVELVPDFFSAENYRKVSQKLAKLVTSISMFYDLENPVKFVSDIEEILSDDGVWHFEQSYMPTMLRQNAYDTVCHEHLEYYSLSVIKYILDAANMKILDVSMNDVNGGSFAVTAAKKNSKYVANEVLINWLLLQEEKQGLKTLKPYRDFADRVSRHRDELKELLEMLGRDGKKVYGYGASTKGNVMLQYCGIDDTQLIGIGEVNPDKFGAFTPKTHIPILSEIDVKAEDPDYLLVLPWHFRNMILRKEHEYTCAGGKFIFPLPYIEII